jgi:hypothetical protein
MAHGTYGNKRAGSSASLNRMRDLTDKVNGEKQAIKAAKKEIRKGGNVTGGGNIVDTFGHEHGYESDAFKKLSASRLVQRKQAQEARQKNKSYAKSDAAKDWEGTPKFGKYGDASETFTRKESKDIVKAKHKKFKKKTKQSIKESKAKAKKTRKSYRNK